MTRGHAWKLFGIGLLCIPICLAGIICLGVGIIIAFIWVGLAFASLYYAVAGPAAPPPDRDTAPIVP
jgi:hypothetical protein